NSVLNQFSWSPSLYCINPNGFVMPINQTGTPPTRGYRRLAMMGTLHVNSPGVCSMAMLSQAWRKRFRRCGRSGRRSRGMATWVEERRPLHPLVGGEQGRAEGGPQNGVAPEIISHVLPPGPSDAEARLRLEELRVRKKAEDSRRKRVTLTRTLAGNPGQLSLFS